MKIQKKRNHGFTLIEVIAVMAIMSLIATIAIPKVTKYIDSANKTRVIAAVSELNNHVLSNEITEKEAMNNIADVLTSYGDLKSLKIGATEQGAFKSGRVAGTLKFDKGVVTAEITTPDELKGTVGPNQIQ